MIRRIAFCVCLSLLPFAAPTNAGEIQIYRWDLTGLDAIGGLGGFAHALLVGPGAGTVVKTRLIVEFTTHDAWDASGVEISLAGPIEQPDGSVGASLEVSGADFGWSGVGHFEVTYETDALNGAIVGTGDPSTLWSMHLNSISNPYLGHFSNLRIELEVEGLIADETCLGDLNGDREVQADDLRYFELGECPPDDDCPADLDLDGVVTQADRQALISIIGTVCPVAP